MNETVSIIIVNYNGYKDTCELIASLQKHESHPYEIIIVDNNSPNKDGDLLKATFPDITVICSQKNLGFAGGNNLGITQAKGDFLFFLNNDTIISRPILKTLIEPLIKDPQIGCVSPKTTFYPQTNLLQYAGATPMSPISMRNKFIGYNRPDQSIYDHAQETAFANGAAMMIRKHDLEIFGVMPECYFLYYEELDWCERMKDAGFKIWYEPQAVVSHKESASIGIQSPLQVYYHNRNRFIFVHRNITSRQKRILSYLYQVTIAIPKRAVCFLVKGKISLISPLLKGIRDGIKYTIRLNKKYESS